MGRKRKYRLNENYFEILNTPDKNYILGFIYADGSVFNNYLSITLNRKDISVLEFIKTEIDYNGPIYIKNDYCRLTISSKKIVSDLFKLGIIENKTYESKTLPLFNDMYLNSFLLGFFDGDGSIFKSSKVKEYEYTINFSTNIYVLNEIKLILSRYNITSSTIRKRYDNEISCMMDIKGSLNLEKLLTLFYTDPPKYYFNRKRELFNDFKISLINLSKRKFNDETINLIKNMYIKDSNQSKIAKELNLTPSSVRTVIQRLRKINIL